VWEKVGKGGCEREGVFEKVGEREREERMRERVCVRERGRMREREKEGREDERECARKREKGGMMREYVRGRESV
jgi:hypothetical protein